MSKDISTTEHENGRKDVTVHVNTIEVEGTDTATLAAKKAIEDKVFPKLRDADVVVTVVYRQPIDGQYMSASKRVKMPQVRAYAEAVVEAFANNFNINPTPDEFIVMEYYPVTDQVKVTKLV